MAGGRSYRDYTVFDVHGKSWKFVWARVNLGMVRGMVHGMVHGMVAVVFFVSLAFLVCMRADLSPSLAFMGDGWHASSTAACAFLPLPFYDASDRRRVKLYFFLLIPLFFLLLSTIVVCSYSIASATTCDGIVRSFFYGFFGAFFP